MWTNFLLNAVTIVTISLSVLIVSMFALFFMNASTMIDFWVKGMGIMVYIEPETDKTIISKIGKNIRSMEGIADATLIPKEEALVKLKKRLEDQAFLLENLKDNPLPDAFEVHPERFFQNNDGIDSIALQIESIPGVAEVEYGREWISMFSRFLKLFKLSAWVMTGLFLMAATFFVANTIKLVFYSRREEIKVMRLVGATENFIRIPFYIQSMIQGALGGIIGLGILYCTFRFLLENSDPNIAAIVSGLEFLSPMLQIQILAGSIALGWTGCFLSLSRFSKFS
ncbi:permease-like cell division protein FtsX [Desulfobacterales bacterium HSG16]|nr:permease-like cell division protein FtsX [Desulfobacterales bacterium HSG16]